MPKLICLPEVGDYCVEAPHKFDKERRIFRAFNYALGIYRNPIYPGLPMSYTELAVLGTLYENPLSKIEDLAKFLRVNKSSISRKLSTLEKKKLLKRKRVPGQSRKLMYALTLEGEKCILDAISRSGVFLELLHHYLGNRKFHQFFEMLESATDALNQLRKERPDIY